MKQNKVVHVKKEKVGALKSTEAPEIRLEDCQLSARKTEWLIMTRSTKHKAVTFVEME